MRPCTGSSRVSTTLPSYTARALVVGPNAVESGKALTPFLSGHESYETGATVAIVNNAVHLGSTRNAFDARIDRTQELLTKPDSATFVPDAGFCDVQLGFRNELPAQRA